MTNDRKPCAATTKSGEPCKNKAQDGSDYCYVHRALAAQAEPKPKKKTAKAAPSPQPSAPAAKNQAASHPQFKELIVELDRFFAASGVFEICGKCHQQGTGCCPPTCRVMGTAGGDPNNKRGKTVFCAAFICSVPSSMAFSHDFFVAPEPRHSQSL